MVWHPADNYDFSRPTIKKIEKKKKKDKKVAGDSSYSNNPCDIRNPFGPGFNVGGIWG